MTPTARQGLGAAGERLAAQRLTQLGYNLLESNWRCPFGELDLIMRDGDVVVFVEVKTRRGESRGMAEETVTTTKSVRLLRAAQRYLADHPPLSDALWRVDLIAITLTSSGAVSRLTHIVNAVQAG